MLGIELDNVRMQIAIEYMEEVYYAKQLRLENGKESPCSYRILIYEEALIKHHLKRAELELKEKGLIHRINKHNEILKQ